MDIGVRVVALKNNGPRQVHPYDQPEAPGVWGDSPEEVGQKAMLGSATKADAQVGVCPPIPQNYE